jgi:hypothetical protein
MKRRRLTALWSTVFFLLSAAGTAEAFSWPWEIPDPWPKTSHTAVTPLGRPAVEVRAGRIGVQPDEGYRFTAFGDQRALADGEWQEIVTAIAERSQNEEPLLFMIDTGDIVNDGTYSDQFAMTREILSPCSDIPYLVAVGNHETKNNREPEARYNLGAFLSETDSSVSAHRMYFRKKIGPVRFYFLDTNDWVYGDHGEWNEARGLAPGSRGAAQLEWLSRSLEADRDERTGSTVVVMHHPIVQSSARHRKQAASLWNLVYEGRALPDILADGGVDLILTGHTHTYERFFLLRRDGQSMHLVNLSGRPRKGFLAFYERGRRAKVIAGEEREWLEGHGWTGLKGWKIVQEEAMAQDEANQFAWFTVDDRGEIVMEVCYLDDSHLGRARTGSPVLLR